MTNGTPLPHMFILPANHVCDEVVAAQYTRQLIVPSLPEGITIQTPEDTILWLCLPVPQGTPGPGIKPVLLPGQEEA